MRLKAVDLVKHYPLKEGLLQRVHSHITAVAGVNLEIAPGEIFGLCGESGCGKSTLARMIAGLIRPSSGRLWLDGHLRSYDALKHQEKAQIQLVFQDPYSAMNPRMTIQQNLIIPLTRGTLALSLGEAEARALEALEYVGMDSHCFARFPHELSGGQQQRICLARSLSMQPRLLILDEVLSALDLSIQAQVLEILKDLRHRLELSMLFITHDLRSLSYLCDQVGVMYRGQMVERGSVESLFTTPRHPYSLMLIESLPKGYISDGMDARVSVSRQSLPFSEEDTSVAEPVPPNLYKLSETPLKSQLGGCVFAHRCPYALERCHSELPPIYMYAEQKRSHHCFFEEIPKKPL